jgi:predicted secreted protein
VKIDKSDNLKALKLKLGEELEIELDENSTTGYRWYQKEGSHSEVLVLKQSSHTESDNKAMGTGGKRLIKLIANSTGEQKLKWVYWQEWNGEDSIDDTFEIVIEVE